MIRLLITLIFLPILFTDYQFNAGGVARCRTKPAMTYVIGTVRQGHIPASGVIVALSTGENAPILATVRSGPHAGSEDWAPGFFWLTINQQKTVVGDWAVWTVDEDGRRSSVVLNLHTGEDCQEAIIWFDRN